MDRDLDNNYCMHAGKPEFLALKWAVCNHFRDYLYYAPNFCVYTDNNSLTYVLSTESLMQLDIGGRTVRLLFQDPLQISQK